jgi:hypothetical protein
MLSIYTPSTLWKISEAINSFVNISKYFFPVSAQSRLQSCSYITEYCFTNCQNCIPFLWTEKENFEKYIDRYLPLTYFHVRVCLSIYVSGLDIVKHCHMLNDDTLVFDSFTACDYTSQITITHRLVSSVTLLSNDFQWWTFLFFWADVLIGWQPSRANLTLWPLASAGTSLSF